MNKIRAIDYIILNIKCGKYLGELIIEGKKKFRLSGSQFMFMAMLSRYRLRQLERGEAKTILTEELRSICNMLDIEYKLALELTDCPPELIEKLTNKGETNND